MPTKQALWVEDNPLRKWRKANGISLVTAAQRIGAASPTTLRLWETGKTQPTFSAWPELLRIVTRNQWNNWLLRRP